MAKSDDNFQDLKELGIDCDDNSSTSSSSSDPLTVKFNQAKNHLQSLMPLDNQILLLLYGYYKQATEGPCNIPKPSWYDMRAKSKWEAWKQLGELTEIEAKTLYIDTIKKLDPAFEETSNFTKSWVTVSTMQHKSSSPKTKQSIFEAVKDGSLDDVKKYLSKTIDVNQVDDNGLGLVHWAADLGKVDILEVLLSAGGDVNLQDADGQTALHYASSCGQVECIRLLLDKGARKDILDNDEEDALGVALDDTIKGLLL